MAKYMQNFYHRVYFVFANIAFHLSHANRSRRLRDLHFSSSLCLGMTNRIWKKQKSGRTLWKIRMLAIREKSDTTITI